MSDQYSERNGPAELPLPEKHYRNQGIGSRATFWRWEQAGLPVLHVGNRRFIRESQLTAFLEKLGAENKKGNVQ